MQIEHKQSPPYPEAALDVNVLTLDGVQYDLDAMQRDSEQIINIKDRDRFLANIILPPMVYHEVDTGEKDPEGTPIYENQAAPIDTAKVRLVLWKKYIEPTTTEEVI